jgi:hypothetical protein
MTGKDDASVKKMPLVLLVVIDIQCRRLEHRGANWVDRHDARFQVSVAISS